MSDFRVFAPVPVAGLITLSAGESHHLVTVNRARTGDTVIAFDGHGTEWTCALADTRKSGAVLQVTSTHTRSLLPCTLTLAQALPKGGVMDDIIRHATELGVTRITPLTTERTQVHLDGERSEKKTEKWRATALEAAKQCGNPFLPTIATPQPLTSWLGSEAVRTAQLRFVASLHPGAHSLKTCLARFRTEHHTEPRDVVWLVGPEGDFSPAEIAATLDAGFLPVTLGPLVLRCDTAATTAISILRHETSS